MWDWSSQALPSQIYCFQGHREAHTMQIELLNCIGKLEISLASYYEVIVFLLCEFGIIVKKNLLIISTSLFNWHGMTLH